MTASLSERGGNSNGRTVPVRDPGLHFNFPPKGWALCNGQLLAIAQNQALFSLVGTTYGGDGRVISVCRAPGNVPIAWGTGTCRRARGEQTHTISQSEFPATIMSRTGRTPTATRVPAGNLLAAANALYGPFRDLPRWPRARSPTSAAARPMPTTAVPRRDLRIALRGIFPSGLGGRTMALPYIGEIRIIAFNFAPVGWMLCAGQQLQISAVRHAVQPDRDDVRRRRPVHVQPPELQSRVPLHWGTNPSTGTTYSLAEEGGVETVTLSTQQMPVHNHFLSATSAVGTQPNPGGNILANSQGPQPYIQENPDSSLNGQTLTPSVAVSRTRTCSPISSSTTSSRSTGSTRAPLN